MSHRQYCSLLILLSLAFNSLIGQNNQRADSLLSILNSSKNDTNKANVLCQLSSEYRKTDSTRALSYAQQSLDLSKELNFSKGIGNAYLQMGAVHRHNGDFSKAIQYDKQAKAQFVKAKFLQGQIKATSALASIYKQQADYDEAFENFTDLMGLAKQAKDTSNIIEALGGYANIYRYKGDYVKSLDYYLQGVKLAEQVNDKQSEAWLLNNMAIIYGYQNNNAEQLKINIRVLEIYEETKDSSNIILGLNNLASYYYDNDEKAKAIELFNKALSMIDKIGVERAGYKYVAQSYEHVGMVAFDQLNYKKAQDYYEKSLDYMIKGKEKKGTTTAYGNLAEVAVALKKWDEAEIWSMKMLNASQEIKYTRGEMDAYSILAQVSYERGDYKKAYDYQSKYLVINQSLLNETSTEQLAELQTRFDTEKKEKEIQSKNEEIKQQAAEAKQRTYILYSFIFAFVILLSMAFYSRRQFLQKKNAFVLLQAKNDLMAELNQQISSQKEILQTKNIDITASISYARTIQNAILVPKEEIAKRLMDFFILTKTKDIVSGDFYFYKESKNGLIVAVADCTGHGVPAGFMSMIGHAFLNEIVTGNESLTPAQILDQLRDKVIKSLNQNSSESTSRDGMDIAIMCIEPNNSFVQFAGALNPLYLIRNGELIEHKADVFPIGIHPLNKITPFTNTRIELQKGDSLYIFSDGFAHQFGGPDERRYMKKQMKELLISIQDKSMDEQELLLAQSFDNWKGDLDQLDDVMVLGIRV